MKKFETPLLELTPSSFAPFGTIIRPPYEPAGRTGHGWETWYGYATLDCPRKLAFGFVATELRRFEIHEMERHPITFELLQPHDDDLVQFVAAPHDLEDDSASPDPARVHAFRIPIGAAIVMAQGTWHSPAFPISRSTTYTFACLEYLEPYTAEWIPFDDDQSVVLRDAPSSP